MSCKRLIELQRDKNLRAPFCFYSEWIPECRALVKIFYELFKNSFKTKNILFDQIFSKKIKLFCNKITSSSILKRFGNLNYCFNYYQCLIFNIEKRQMGSQYVFLKEEFQECCGLCLFNNFITIIIVN